MGKFLAGGDPGITLDESWRTDGAADFTLEAHPSVVNPVLTAAHVTDVANVDYIADPFVVVEGGVYYLFYEAHISTNGYTVLCYSTSNDGLAWTYGAKILDSVKTGSNALSYPLVFKASGEWYMLPDLFQKKILLFRAKTFPTDWQPVATLLTPVYTPADATIFQWQGNWYLFVKDHDGGGNNCNIYSSDRLYGGVWTAHPSNPIYTGLRNTRPGGRPVLRGATIDFFFQDGLAHYGDKVRKYTITDLTPATFTASEAAESPLLEAGSGWNGYGMHTLDRLSPSLSLVDGWTTPGQIWSIGIYHDVP